MAHSFDLLIARLATYLPLPPPPPQVETATYKAKSLAYLGDHDFV